MRRQQESPSIFCQTTLSSHKICTGVHVRDGVELQLPYVILDDYTRLQQDHDGDTGGKKDDDTATATATTTPTKLLYVKAKQFWKSQTKRGDDQYYAIIGLKIIFSTCVST